MTFIESKLDLEALTITFVAEFPASTDRVWQLWEDPRQLERWWGPPGYPATFTRHDFTAPGKSVYFMEGPEGDRHYGWWSYESIDAPHSLGFVDGFGDANGDNDPSMPSSGTTTVSIEPAGDVTRMTIFASSPNAEDLQALVAMGMIEGMTLALGQIDAILAED
jgi:uncharacterized protein YndB with AHSA1/START domain